MISNFIEQSDFCSSQLASPEHGTGCSTLSVSLLSDGITMVGTYKEKITEDMHRVGIQGPAWFFYNKIFPQLQILKNKIGYTVTSWTSVKITVIPSSHLAS